MRELTIEEKAKRYDEAKERMKDFLNEWEDCGAIGEAMEKARNVFPELKESEDERIRKIIKQSLKSYFEGKLSIGTNDVDYAICLSWLKKQGEQKPNPCENCGIATNNCQKFPCTIRDGEQKPAWSEEDEEMLNVVIKSCEQCGNEYAYYWLKSIKNRVQPQTKQEWSEEDDKKRKGLIKGLEDKMGFGWTTDPFSREEYIDWLKSLRPQNNIVTDEELAQAKKDAYNDALDKIEYHSGNPTFDDGWHAAIWYLKKRNTISQSQWKPSDDEMEALSNAISLAKNCGEESAFDLRTLYERLKKLREE